MPYREAWSRETIVDALSAVRLKIANEAADMDSLRVEEARLLSEVAAFGLPKLRASIPLSAWPRVRIASPCNEDWNAMQGEGAVRRCTRCERDVYNLSGMTSSAVKALLHERGEAPCVRFYRRPDGTVLTSDCEAPVRKSRVVLRVLGAAACTVALGGAIAYVEAIQTPRAYVLTSRLPPPDPPATVMGLMQVDASEDADAEFDESTAALDWYESEQDEE